MPKKLDPRLIEILTKHGEDVEAAIWDCHGTWVVYHSAIERIAAKAKVVFDMPQIIEANSANKTVAIAVRGVMGETSEWSFGEATPANNKNAYPYAMAEKRAKDRVVLKLVGLHGLAYSEEESDDFKPNAPPRKANGLPEKGYREDGTRTSYALKNEQPELWEEFQRELAECQTHVSLERFKTEWRTKASKERWNPTYLATAKDQIEGRDAAILEEMERLMASSPDELVDLPLQTALEHSIRNNPLRA